MRVEVKTVEKIVRDVKELVGLDVSLGFAVGQSFKVSNGRHEFLACYYGNLKGYTVLWAVEVRDVRAQEQVYRANVARK